MKINVASKNPVKVEAVRETIVEYPILKDAEVKPLEVASGVSDQPRSLEETIMGAKNRALNAFKDCSYSFGLESGLMSVPHTKTGSMEFCACAIYDGSKYHLGLSPAFEFPAEITRMIHEEGMNATDAAVKIGLAKDANIKSTSGIISLITNGRVSRKDYTKQAIKMALIHLEHPELYEV